MLLLEEKGILNKRGQGLGLEIGLVFVLIRQVGAGAVDGPLHIEVAAVAIPLRMRRVADSGRMGRFESDALDRPPL